MKQQRKNRLLAVLIAVGLLAAILQAAPATAAFDLDTGNAPVEVIIPTAVPFIFNDVSPTGSDVSLVIRITTLITKGNVGPLP